MILSSFHKAARAWAEAGYYVFPCVEGGKEPACANGCKDATTDLTTIDRWWTENPAFNVACAPDLSGHVVLDVDPPLGMQSLAALEAENGALPATFQVRTPRGGDHYWFEGRLPNSASKIGEGLDIRGVGGYVLVPPSVIAPGRYKKHLEGGSYADKNEGDIVPIVAWVVALAQKERDHQSSGSDAIDQAHNIERARDRLHSRADSGDVATEGQGGNDRTYRLFGEMYDLGLSKEKALDLVLEIWNPKCDPPWKDEETDELEALAENAWNYRQNEVGAYAVKSAGELFSHIECPADEVESVRKNSRFRLYTLEELQALPPPTWIIPGLIPAKSLVVAYGRLKSFKSFLMLDLAMAVSAGVPTFGYTPEPGPVVYAVGEGQWNIANLHAPAWRIARDQCDKAIPFHVVTTVPRAVDPGEAKELIAQVRAAGVKPRLVVLDTMARGTLGLDENSSKDVNLFVAACDYIREQLDCTVLVIHHAGKTEGRGSRGSNVLEAAADTVLEIMRHEKSTAVEVWVREQRSAQEREAPFTFEGKVVGPSLAFFPTGEAEHRALVHVEKLSDMKPVYDALQKLNAYGLDNAVSAAVLAATLAPDLPDTKKLERLLRKEARPGAPLEALHADGSWMLPTPS